VCLLSQTTPDEQIQSGCEKSQLVEGCQDAEALDLSSGKEIAGSLPYSEVLTDISLPQWS
jgi:hypothetical protein